MTRRTAALLVTGLLVLLGGAGCVDLPTSGPVVEAAGDGEQDTDRAADVDARPPVEDATPVQLVNGYLDAMTAWPIQPTVAKQFLTSDAAEEWNPDAGTIIYSDYLPPEAFSGGVRVELAGADRLDGSGGWRGALPDAERTVEFRVVREDGQYRIANPPDGLLVPTAWFKDRFRQVSLYFLDPVAEILVPEPVFVPIGEQLATDLVTALLAGPPVGLDDVVRTVVPEGLSVELSVPVSEAGVAQIDLIGDATPLAREEVDLLMAQFAWTLRQDESIDAFRVTIGGEDIGRSGTVTPYDVGAASSYDPAGAGASNLLYGLGDGLLKSGPFGQLEATAGPFGSEDRGVASFAVTPDGGTVAAVVAGGRRLDTAPVQVDGRVNTVLRGESLARPSWDAAERLWVLDRTRQGAVIRVVSESGIHEVDVPGATGANVRRLMVSRDGTRLVSVIREGGEDRVITFRVVIDARGAVRRVTDPTVISSADGLRVIDITWTDPVSVSVLSPAQAGNLFEVSTIPANGGFQGAADTTVILRGRVRGVADTPTPRPRLLAVRPGELVDVASRDTEALTEGVHSVDYAG